MDIKKLLANFDSCLQKHCAHIYDYYQPALPDEEIDELLRQLGIQNNAFRELYRCKNWLEFLDDSQLPKEDRIMFHGNFVSLSNVVWLKERDVDGRNWWGPTKIVFANTRDGEKLLIETDINSPDHGVIFSFVSWGSWACEPIPIYADIESMIRSIIVLFESGAVFYDKEDDFLETDFDREYAFCAVLNKGMRYWEEK